MDKRILILIIAIIPLSSAAQTISSNSTMTSFRHPLLQGEGFATNNDYRGTLKPTSPVEKIIERCDYTFRHPALNRCEKWSVASVEKKPQSELKLDPLLVQHRLDLAARARTLLKNPNFVVGDRDYPADCSGLILAVFAAENNPLDELLKDAKPGESNVAALYRAAAKRKLLHKHRVPDIGDLVFFDNTWDRNMDGQANDPLTHIGIVERVDPDGTISFIHRSRGGVLRYKMNLFSPRVRRDPKTNKVLNQYLGVNSKNSARKWRLSGELFNSFATIAR